MRRVQQLDNIICKRHQIRDNIVPLYFKQDLYFIFFSTVKEWASTPESLVFLEVFNIHRGGSDLLYYQSYSSTFWIFQFLSWPARLPVNLLFLYYFVWAEEIGSWKHFALFILPCQSFPEYQASAQRLEESGYLQNSHHLDFTHHDCKSMTQAGK